MVELRKRGVDTTASLAYWVGNPVLNPAVVVFLFLAAPWQFGAVRVVVGLALVLAGTVTVTWLADHRPDAGARCLPAELRSPEPPDPVGFTQFPVRWLSPCFGWLPF